MRNLFKYTDSLIAEWTARLNLPYLEISYVNEKDCKEYMKACIDIEYHKIILNVDRIKTKKDLIMIIIHELCHAWYYYRFLDERFMSEKRVIDMTYYILKRYYPEVYEHAVSYGLEFLSNWDLSETEPEHYYGYLKALQRYGVITYHVKKC